MELDSGTECIEQGEDGRFDEEKFLQSDCESLQKRSHKKQWVLIFLCWFMYTVAQLGRYSYSSNINPVMAKFGISHTQASLPATLFFFAYGAGQLINAFLCKRYNKRFVLGGVLLISGAVNLTIFIGVPFRWICALWFVNGVVQSALWGSLILMLSENVEKALFGRAAFVMSTATLGGTFLSYGLSALLSIDNHYEWAFCIAGGILLAVCVLWVALFNCVAKQKKVQEKNHAKKSTPKENGDKRKMSGVMIFTIATLAVFAICNHLLSGGLQTWLPSILTEMYGLGNAFSVFLTILLPFVGVFASLLCEMMYRGMKDFILLNGAVFAVAAVALFLLIWFIEVSWVLALVLFLIVRLAMGVGANALTSRFPLYMGKNGSAGFLASFMNGSCYLGQTISTYGFGAIADCSGWMQVFWLSFAVGLLPAVLSVTYGIIKWIHKYKRPKHENT